MPKFIQGYNGKPALVTKSGTFARRDNYIEFSINVNMWAFLARRGLFALIPSFPDFVFNVGFTIESRNDEEMPGERLLTHLMLPPTDDCMPFFTHRCGVAFRVIFVVCRGSPGRMQTREFGSG